MVKWLGDLKRLSIKMRHRLCRNLKPASGIFAWARTRLMATIFVHRQPLWLSTGNMLGRAWLCCRWTIVGEKARPCRCSMLTLIPSLIWSFHHSMMVFCWQDRRTHLWVIFCIHSFCIQTAQNSFCSLSLTYKYLCYLY